MTDKTDSKEREALVAYLKDCDAHDIVPDVGGAWHAAFQAGRASLAANAGSEPVAWVDERALSWLANSRSRSATITTQLERGKSFERPMPLYTHPSPPEGMVGGWMPIETAPEGQMVVVGWLDPEDPEHPERHDFDLLEDGCWQQWHERAEHVEVIGGHGVSYTPPYTVWMPVRPIPTTSAGSGKGE